MHGWQYGAVFLFGFCALPWAQASSPLQGAKAAGMNTAFTALADDPSAILHNPAGLVQIESTRITTGAAVLIPITRYEGDGVREKTGFRGYTVPHFYMAYRLNNSPLTAGLGVYSPFGVGGRVWPGDGATRYSSIESTIGTVALNPTLAWEIDDHWSVALGIDYMRAQTISENAIDQSALGAADGRLKIDEEGGDWGYNLGLLYRSGDGLSIGLSYRSAVRIDQSGTFEMSDIAPALQPLFGGTEFSSPAHSTIEFPATLNAGIAYRSPARWTIDFDVEWSGWSSFHQGFVDIANEVPAAGLTDVTVPLDWHDVWAYKFGYQLQLDRQLALRAGVAYVHNPVPEYTLTAANPDSDQRNISIGLGWKKGRWDIDAFYNFTLYETRRVNNDILSGTYKGIVHLLGLGVTYRL